MSKEITSKTKRLAQIFALLEQGPILVQDLSLRFGVSFRTIQRDILLILNTKMPLISPQQSVYKFAEGFCLSKINLSNLEAALLVISFDIAGQIGEDFAPAQENISKRFIPKSFDHCIFGASRDNFAPDYNLAQNLIQSIENRYIVQVFLKDIKKKRNLYPVKLLCLWDKWYIVSVMPSGRISYFNLENIDNLTFPQNTKTGANNIIFHPKAFIDWAIWQKAHQWVIDLNPDKNLKN